MQRSDMLRASGLSTRLMLPVLERGGPSSRRGDRGPYFPPPQPGPRGLQRVLACRKGSRNPRPASASVQVPCRAGSPQGVFSPEDFVAGVSALAAGLDAWLVTVNLRSKITANTTTHTPISWRKGLLISLPPVS